MNDFSAPPSVISTAAPCRLHAPGFQFGNGIRHLFGVAGADGDAGAFAGQCIGNRAPDAARAPEHDRVSALQTQIHGDFLC